MSIYGSFCDMSGDWGTIAAPLAYQGSHVLPDGERDVRGGFFDLGLIPGFITRGERHLEDEEDGNDGAWPYLRVSMRGDNRYRDDFTDTIVLDGQQVARLRDELNVWLVRAGVEDSDEHWTDIEARRREKWSDES